MTVVSIPQLEALLRGVGDLGFTFEDVVAVVPAAAKYGFALITVADGDVAPLSDGTLNLVNASGGRVGLELPAAVQGRARDFIVRVSASDETRVRFTGGGRFVSDDGGVFAAVQPDSEAVFFFTELEPGVFMVSRKAVQTVEQEDE